MNIIAQYHSSNLIVILVFIIYSLLFSLFVDCFKWYFAQVPLSESLGGSEDRFKVQVYNFHNHVGSQVIPGTFMIRLHFLEIGRYEMI